MELQSKVTVYGHKFSLNVAVKDGLDWTGKAPKYVHFCLIELGDDKEKAFQKAQIIKKAMGEEYKFNLCADPITWKYSEKI